jgi:hypothetical protein
MTLTTVNAGMLDTQAQYNGFKNRLINGAMVIDQRNAGASVTGVSGNIYTVDRFFLNSDQASKFSAQQVTDAPTGFVKSLKVTSSSTYSVPAGEGYNVQQRIEGFNMADLMWGTASAATVTLSFWVKSSLTGTFGGAFRNAAGNRSYPFSYTISAANTWEYETITIAGDTTGTWPTDNTNGVSVIFGLGVGTTNSGTAGAWAAVGYYSATGAVSLVGTNAATWQVTGVQLEKGSTATSFDYRPYGTELALCQRYYYRLSGSGAFYSSGVCRSSTVLTSNVVFASTMRTAPSAFTQTGTASDYGIFTGSGSTTTCSAVPFIDDSSQNSARVELTVSSGLTAGQAAMARSLTAASFFGFSAEL